jgi:hypothetical protein
MFTNADAILRSNGRTRAAAASDPGADAANIEALVAALTAV